MCNRTFLSQVVDDRVRAAISVRGHPEDPIESKPAGLCDLEELEVFNAQGSYRSEAHGVLDVEALKGSRTVPQRRNAIRDLDSSGRLVLVVVLRAAAEVAVGRGRRQVAASRIVDESRPTAEPLEVVGEVNWPGIDQVHLIDEADGDPVFRSDQKVELLHLHVVRDGHLETVSVDEVLTVLVQ